MQYIPRDVVEALQQGRLIEAIKGWRDYTGADLRTAKDFIENNREEILHAYPPIKPRSMSEELPKQELLIKLMGMTTAANDGEALTAIRKANEFLLRQGWDWRKLIEGRVKIVENPFKNLSTPPAGRSYEAPSAPRPQPQSRPQPSYSPSPPRPQPRAGAPRINSSRSNLYAGWCYCCGAEVAANAGRIFDPHTFNSSAKTKWQIVCGSCNMSAYPAIASNPAKKQQPAGWAGGPAPSTSQL